MTSIEATRGDTNVYDLDANIPLVQANDKIWFTAKRRSSDADDDAVIQRGLNVVGLAGIVVTDEALGKFQVQIPPDMTEDLTDQALMYDVQLRQNSTGAYFTLQEGSMFLTGQVTKST